MKEYAEGTKRKCYKGDHKIAWTNLPFGHWYHYRPADWEGDPHKAIPKKYKVSSE